MISVDEPPKNRFGIFIKWQIRRWRDVSMIWKISPYIKWTDGTYQITNIWLLGLEISRVKKLKDN